MSGFLTCINIVKGIGHSVQALKEVVIIDSLRIGSHSVLMRCDPDGWVHLLHSSSCCVTLHFLKVDKEGYYSFWLQDELAKSADNGLIEARKIKS